MASVLSGLRRSLPNPACRAPFGAELCDNTIASEIGDIGRFASPAKLCGYTGLCPRVKQSGAVDARGPISKHGPDTCAGRCSTPP
jgi:transposase